MRIPVSYLRPVAAALCGALLLACGGPSTRPDAAPTAADADYLRGRDLHLAQRYDEAIAAYQDALHADAGHVNARNGLAVAYAERGDFTRAIPIWRALTDGATMASGPAASYLFANLGHAYQLGGDPQAAKVALEKACLLDPLDANAWQYLGETLLTLGDEERGRQMLHQAEALRGHDFRADYARADGGARMPAIEQAVRSAPRPDGDWATLELVRNDNGVLELHRIPAPHAGASASAPARQAAVALLEISNGNGRPGMARRLTGELRDPGFKVVRLTNEKGFGVRQTRIEYQPAFRGAAERLALRVGVAAPLAAGVKGPADVRLVLGHDLPAHGVDTTLARADGHASP